MRRLTIPIFILCVLLTGCFTAGQSGSKGCCKYCSKGKSCGNSCISQSYNCTKPGGCACLITESGELITALQVYGQCQKDQALALFVK